jgi:hypothetical protein
MHAESALGSKLTPTTVKSISNKVSNFLQETLALFGNRLLTGVSSSPKLSSPMHLKLTPTKACEVNPEPKFTSTIVATLSNESIA